jgi:predicted nucleic acid-binding protein
VVSAFVADGPPRRVLEEARSGAIVLIVPELVLEELVRVLAAKLGASAEASREAVQSVRDIATTVVQAPVSVEPVTGDPADDEILACAIEGEATVLVTGDRRHLLPVGEHRGVRIRAPQALLAELRGPR